MTGCAAQELGGFSRSLVLLEFDQIREQLVAMTRTVMGEERAKEVEPSRDLMDIAVRQQETAEAREFLDQGGALEFGPGVDLRELVNRAKLNGVLRGEELHTVQGSIAAARHNRGQLVRREELPLLMSVAQNIPDFSVIEQAVGQAISPAGEVLDDASPTLRQLRNESRSAYNQLNEVMQRSLRRLQRRSVVQEPIITQRNGRLVLLIKADFKSQAPGIVHDVSDSGATVFVEPMPAIELGNRWRETRLAEEREEERILRHLSGLVGDAGDDLLLTLDLVARLDFALAKGRYSVQLRGTAPVVEDPAEGNGRLKLSGARHPLLSGQVVPINLEMGESYRVVLITGPNAGGKTVALKTVGLLAMMAQAGLHVPAEEARFPLLDGIYADIGDQQSIEQSLSTFSSHVQNLRWIMEQVTPQSLVLADELGTSTDPEEGSALAEAILSHLHRQGTLVVATTHHRGVARYVQEQPQMMNASVDLDPQTLAPTYRVTLGLPGRSYAMTIAARLGIAPEIVEHAQSLMSPTQRETEDLLQELREERSIVEGLRQESERLLAQARIQQGEVEERLAAVEATKIELVEDARQELQGRISHLTNRLEQAERWLREDLSPRPHPAAGRLEEGGQHRSQQEEASRHRLQLDEARRELSQVQWEPIELQRTPWQEQLVSGDRVFIRGIPRPVEVIGPPDEDEQVEVLLGTMRARVPLYQLDRPADGGADNGGGTTRVREPEFRQVPGAGIFYQRTPNQEPAATEIDLHGNRVDEALEKVETLLHDASLDGASQVRINHGRGTGALRRAVREYLTGHPLVLSVRPDEGPAGLGVTIAGLR